MESTLQTDLDGDVRKEGCPHGKLHTQVVPAAAAQASVDLKKCRREVSDDGTFVAGNVAGIAVEENP